MSTTDKKYAKLLFISADNNNKYYEMIQESSNEFTINYGRVDVTKTTLKKPTSQWEKIYAEKIKKGYKDVTHLVSITVDTTSSGVVKTKKIDDVKVEQFLSLMESYTKGLVAKTYSVKSTNVTEAQIKEAQRLINELSKLDKKKDEKTINKNLLDLYTVIPRKMSKVQRFILPEVDFDKTMVQEQDNLDAMASQVKMFNVTPNQPQSQEKSLLDILGISMKECHQIPKEVDYLIKQVNGRYKVAALFEVNKPQEDTTYDKWVLDKKNKTSRILIHGTRCTSVIPILETGLKIRPAGNFQFSGKVYGDGNYFSEVVQKSLGYTGYDNDKVLLVYEVHVGNPFIYEGWYKGNNFTLNYKNLSERGFDSTYVKAGGGLLNSEIITYHEDQNRIKYIIHVKN